MIKYKQEYLYKEALVTEKQRQKIALRIDADGTDGEEFSKLLTIQNNIVAEIEKGMQLYIHSGTAGNGKSSWALRLLQSYFNKIWLRSGLTCRALFINVPRFLLELKSNISSKSEYISHIMQYVQTADLIIWDDIATKTATQYEAENLLSLIDARINSGKANIFTSNLNNEELHQALGDRLASRICQLGYNIEFHGGDKRSTVNKE